MILSFKKYIQEISSITDVEFENAMPNFKKLELKKGEYFVEYDRTCKRIGYIHKGILRNYYINEKGEEITSCFCVENNMASSYKSFILQQPSNVAVVAMEKTEMLVIHYEDLQKLYHSSAAWQNLGRLLAEKEYIIMEQYASVLNNESAKEKYERLLREQPEILQKSPVQYIASYLGVTRETLSRIRSKISS